MNEEKKYSNNNLVYGPFRWIQLQMTSFNKV